MFVGRDHGLVGCRVGLDGRDHSLDGSQDMFVGCHAGLDGRDHSLDGSQDMFVGCPKPDQVCEIEPDSFGLNEDITMFTSQELKISAPP